MRNLKKILALVLALMMVLSVMVTASAASFTDADEINGKYTEAVGVLSGIGVIDGFKAADGSYSFQPNGTLTRAQAAKIVSYILVGDLGGIEDLADGVDMSFTDVPSWAEPYVAYCYSKGIISGRNATTYDPNGVVTGYEFGKMLLIAAGLASDYTFTTTVFVVNGVEYTDSAVAMVSAINTGAAMETKVVADPEWKVTVSEGLKSNYIWSGADFALSKKLTREEACYLAFNTMNASSLMSNFDAVEVTENLGNDELGRPVAVKWVTEKDETVYVAYEEELTTVYGATYNPVVDTPSKTWDFSYANYWYNGAEDVANWDGSDLTKPGVTSELYGYYDKVSQKYIVETVVSTEYYFATIKDVAANGDITLFVDEATLEKDIPVVATKDETTGKYVDPNYPMLADYAKGTALAVLVVPNWENELTILDVDTVDPLTGAISVIAHDGNYNGYITVGGTEYTFANEYNQAAVNFASKGTFYLHNGLVLGYVAPEDEVVTPDVVYLVKGYDKETTVTDEYTGSTSYATTYWAQCVNMNGEIVTYQTKTSVADKEKGLYTVTVKYDADDKVNYATFGETGNTSTGAIKSTDLKVTDTSNYYTSDVKFIFVNGELGTLKVSVADGVQNVDAGSNKYYVAETVLGDSVNKTVKYVVVAGKVATEDPAPTEDIVFAAEANPSITAVAYLDADGKAAIGYQHTVYIDGVKTNIVTTDDAALSGFISLTPVVEGVYSTAANGATTLKAATKVTNMFNGLLTTKDVTDKDVTGVTVVNVSGNTKVPTDATKLSTEDTVALVTDKLGNVTLIYVTDSTRTK